jgi:hypothetical protein
MKEKIALGHEILNEGGGSVHELSLLKGKAQYSGPPLTSLVSPFDIANIIDFFSKPSYVNEEVYGIEPSPSLVRSYLLYRPRPCLDHYGLVL